MGENGGASSNGAANFGDEVRAWRVSRGLTQEGVGDACGYGRSYVAMVETGSRLASEEFAAGCDRLFGTPETFARMRARAARSGIPEWFAPYVELERAAISIRTFQSQVFPGFLQTEDYARAMLSAVRPENLEELVAARMERRAILARESPPYVWAILDEQALRRTIGGLEVMRGQLEHLLDAGGHPRTVIQVIPERIAAHAGLAGPFTLLSFAEGPDVLFVDGHSQGRLGYDQAEVAGAVRSYDLLRAVALSPEESADLIRGYVEGLK